MEGCLFPFHIVNDLWSLAASLLYFLLQTEEQSKKAAESIRILATLLLQQVQAEGGSFLGRRGLGGSEQREGLGGAVCSSCNYEIALGKHGGKFSLFSEYVLRCLRAKWLGRKFSASPLLVQRNENMKDGKPPKSKTNKAMNACRTPPHVHCPVRCL